MKEPNNSGRKWSNLVVTFRKIVQKDHHFENQAITQNGGLNN